MLDFIFSVLDTAVVTLDIALFAGAVYWGAPRVFQSQGHRDISYVRQDELEMDLARDIMDRDMEDEYESRGRSRAPCRRQSHRARYLDHTPTSQRTYLLDPPPRNVSPSSSSPPWHSDLQTPPPHSLVQQYLREQSSVKDYLPMSRDITESQAANGYLPTYLDDPPLAYGLATPPRTPYPRKVRKRGTKSVKPGGMKRIRQIFLEKRRRHSGYVEILTIGLEDGDMT